MIMASLSAVSDKMKYAMKPIAVESKTHLLTLPFIGAASYTGDTSSNIFFRIQHNPSGRSVDSSRTKIKFTFTPYLSLFVINCKTPASSNVVLNHSLSYADQRHSGTSTRISR